MTWLQLLTPTALIAAGIFMFLAGFLVWWPRRRHPWAAGIISFNLIGVSIFGWWADSHWKPFGEPIGLVIWQWIAFLVAVIAATFTPLKVALWRRIFVDLLAILLAILAFTLTFNYHFSMFRYPNELWSNTEKAALPPPPQRTGAPVFTRPASQWTKPVDLPTKGVLAEARIPGTVSGFKSRSSLIYLPPAYAAANRPQLPVLLLMAGQPGDPTYWQRVGHIDEIMDTYAANHSGISPIVVIPDHLGSHVANPLCSNANLGNNATFLETDVVTWTIENLDVDPDTRHWAVAGLSNGGTCATQLATRRSDLFTTFVSISGEIEPTLGNRSRTVSVGFDDDEKKFAANNPIDLMSHNRYPDTLGIFTVGDKDAKFTPWAQQLTEAGKAAGMDARLLTVSGGHDWSAWVNGLKDSFPIIMPRMGLPA
ncbi:MAG: alpha/beta hydrolase [Propionibacteriaceae bacterium]